MTIGDTKFPSKIPNLNQILFKGVNIEELNKPNNKKIIASITAQTLIFPLFNSGNIETIKKNKQNTIPKLLFVLILILFFFKIKSMMVA